MNDATCNGSGYVDIDGCDFRCYGCADCDFDFGEDYEAEAESEEEPCPF